MGPKVADTELHKERELFTALKGHGSFWIFKAEIRIVPHSRDSFSVISDSDI